MERKVSRLARVLLAIFIALVVSSCASQLTPYQPLDESGGYKEEKQSDGSYKLVYIGNLQVDISSVKKYWIKRAKELCGDNKYNHKINQTKDITTEKITSGGIEITKLVEPPSIEGIVICK